MSSNQEPIGIGAEPQIDWSRIARLVLTSRALDDMEEQQLLPKGLMFYQFSARGHELVQILLGSLLTNARDAACGYYRSRPLLLSLGLSSEDALASALARSAGYSDGRDIGAVCNLPSRGAATILPMAGDVGAQFTPTVGWARAIDHRSRVMGDVRYQQSIAVALGGDGSTATNGFWAALNTVTTLKLPYLFSIEDNGYSLSVPSHRQTPGGNIARNLAAFTDLFIIEGDGTDPVDAARKLRTAVDYVRSHRGPALIRLTVPRLCGHSGQDTQAYKPAEAVAAERERDPLIKLKQHLVPTHFSESQWQALERSVHDEVNAALERALKRAPPNPESLRRYVFAETKPDGSSELAQQGGVAVEGHVFPTSSAQPEPEPSRINMLTAIRRTLAHELKTNDKLLVFGEDVGRKGGVHAATMGLQDQFGADRVFDTSLSEEGIIGSAIGLAMAGLMPVAEIQFRKYADPATEQLNNCGTVRWRTTNRFAAPIVVRIPCGASKCGDPWHSVSNEVMWAHAVGWRVAYPSNAEDAVGLLRSAMRGNDPTIFFEQRLLLDDVSARRPYPGDAFALPFGKACIRREGKAATVVSWGLMVSRCEQAAERCGLSIEVIDLRTLSPWDRTTVLESVAKTRRCLIVHEDTLTAGFGAEVAAIIAQEALLSLDAPIRRLAPPDIPLPHDLALLDATLPSVELIANALIDLVGF